MCTHLRHEVPLALSEGAGSLNGLTETPAAPETGGRVREVPYPYHLRSVTKKEERK